MFNPSLSCCSISITFIFVNMLALSHVYAHRDSTKLNTLRKLDLAVHSVSLEWNEMWYNYKMPSDINFSSDINFISEWTVFISSNETIVGNQMCSPLSQDLCSIIDCYEDSSSIYSVAQPHFSSNKATRINLTTNEISIADGAWELNSSLLYMHDCEYDSGNYGNLGGTIGQIGLGLSGKAYRNFQTEYPIFSFVFNSKSSAELIFGVDETYTNSAGADILVPCDLDWKMQVNSISFGNSIVSSSPVTMIFNIQNSIISLPEAYYYQLKAFFFQMSVFTGCQEPTSNFFWCVFIYEVHDLPSLVFSLEDGTQFTLPPEVYCVQPGVVEFRHYNSTFSGVDYIILGYPVMSHYYTVFQLSDNETPTITLYPLDLPTIDPKSPELSLDSTLEPENAAIGETNTSQTQVPADSPVVSELNTSSSSTHNRNDSETNQNIQYFIIGVLLIVLISTFIVLIFRVIKGWLVKYEGFERSRPTVELGEKSYFVTSNNDNNSNSNDDIDS